MKVSFSTVKAAIFMELPIKMRSRFETQIMTIHHLLKENCKAEKAACNRANTGDEAALKEIDILNDEFSDLIKQKKFILQQNPNLVHIL